MKYTKIFLAALSSLFLLASCEEPKTLSGDATVGFEAPELEYGLGSEYITVPIVTEGETSIYPIKVTVEVAAYEGDYAAVEDKDFLITSKEVFIASKDSKPGLEIKLANPDDKDELRFKLVITSQENAQSIGQKETLVKCAKSELDRVCGSYLFEGVIDGASGSETWILRNDGANILIYNIFGEEGPLAASYDVDKKILSIPIGAANPYAAYNFTGIGVAYVCPVLAIPTSEGKPSQTYTSGTLECQVSDDYSSIELNLPEGYSFFGGVFSPDSGKYLGWFSGPFTEADGVIKKAK